MDFTLLAGHWVNAAVFVQQWTVSRHARETEQSRETIYGYARRIAQEPEEGQRERLAFYVEIKNSKRKTFGSANKPVPVPSSLRGAV